MMCHIGAIEKRNYIVGAMIQFLVSSVVSIHHLLRHWRNGVSASLKLACHT